MKGYKMDKLDADWLSVEFAAAEAEVASWSEGLRASLFERDPLEVAEGDETTSDRVNGQAALRCQ
ncbi:hypothetical protein [Methylobacterium sp.]|uniref:hypothetical protein n=1 Tax=Methylobacterium sp. TaxID=409 RepID=UPI003B02AF46